MVICVIFGVFFRHLVFMIMVVTRSGSMSPPSKKHSVENPKGNVKKKAMAVKSKVDNVVSQLVKSKQPEVASHKKKAKAKRVKLTYEEVSFSLEVNKTSGVSSSSSVKICIVLFFVCFICVYYYYLFSNKFYYYI